MEKTKGRSICKTAMAVVLSIGLFSALFIGANSLVLAASNNREAPVPETTAQVSTAARENAAPEGINRPRSQSLKTTNATQAQKAQMR